MFPLCLNELQTSTGHYNSRIPALLHRDACHFPLHTLRLESPMSTLPSLRPPSPSCPLSSATGSPSTGFKISLFGKARGVQKVAPLHQVFYKHSSKKSSLPLRVSAFGKTRLIGRLSKQGLGEARMGSRPPSHPRGV